MTRNHGMVRARYLESKDTVLNRTVIERGYKHSESQHEIKKECTKSKVGR